MSDFFAVVQNDESTGNPTLEIQVHIPGGTVTGMREGITVEEMRRLADALNAEAQNIEMARRADPNWEKRSYRVG